MHGIEFTATPMGEQSWCAECGKEMKEGQFCLRLYGEHLLCSQGCADSFRANFVGRDFIAAHDQATAKVREALEERPQNFIFMYSSSDYEIQTCVMARPEFVQACIPLMIQVSMGEGDVESPD